MGRHLRASRSVAHNVRHRHRHCDEEVHLRAFSRGQRSAMEGGDMRLRVDRIALVGTSREVGFAPGLNVIEGPISTGKSALMRLLRVLLGNDFERDWPEVNDAVTDLAGQIVIGDETYAVRRRLITTPTAD